MNKPHGFVSYHKGEGPNIALQYLSFCCCSIPWILVAFGVYNAASEILKEEFPPSSGRNILFTFFPIAGAIILDPILRKREQELGIANAAPNMQTMGMLGTFCFLTLPLYLSALINRLNAIDAASNK